MSTVKSRRDQFSEATRAALIDAATRRFADLGFSGTSLEDVAADIQATRGAVYHHFSSKKALFEAVFAKLEQKAVDDSKAAGAKSDDAWESALLALDAFLDHCADPVYGRVVWQEGPIALGWVCWEELELEFAYGVVEHYVRRLIEDGRIEPTPLEPTTRLAYAMLGAAGMALARASADDKAQVRAEYTEVITRMLIGLQPR